MRMSNMSRAIVFMTDPHAFGAAVSAPVAIDGDRPGRVLAGIGAGFNESLRAVTRRAVVVVKHGTNLRFLKSSPIAVPVYHLYKSLHTRQSPRP